MEKWQRYLLRSIVLFWIFFSAFFSFAIGAFSATIAEQSSDLSGIHPSARLISWPTDKISLIPIKELQSQLQAAYGRRKPQQWGERLPGIALALPVFSTYSAYPSLLADTDSESMQIHDISAKRICITLDACGGRAGSSYDAETIDFLRREKIPAHIFVTSLWLRANKTAAEKLAADPLFHLEAHGFKHRPCSVTGRSVYGIQGTASIAELLQEVEQNARDIEEITGYRPIWFRSGTAFYDEIALEIIHLLGFQIAGYTVSADEGATLSSKEVEGRILKTIDGSIILCHLNHPESGTGKGLRQALKKLKAQGVIFVTLEGKMAL